MPLTPQQRTGADSFTSGPYALKWTLANEHELVFAVVYQKALPLAYVDAWLVAVKHAFLEQYGASVRNVERTFAFDKKFDAIWQDVRIELARPHSLCRSSSRPGRRRASPRSHAPSTRRRKGSAWSRRARWRRL